MVSESVSKAPIFYSCFVFLFQSMNSSVKFTSLSACVRMSMHVCQSHHRLLPHPWEKKIRCTTHLYGIILYCAIIIYSPPLLFMVESESFMKCIFRLQEKKKSRPYWAIRFFKCSPFLISAGNVAVL